MSSLKIGLIGDYREGYLPHEKAIDGLVISSDTLGIAISYEWIPTSSAMVHDKDFMSQFHGFWAGSGPYESNEGTLAAIAYARKNKIPLLGTCSGFKYMVYEFALHVLDKENYTEYIGKNNCGTDYRDVYLATFNTSKMHTYYSNAHCIEKSHCSFSITESKLSELCENELEMAAIDLLTNDVIAIEAKEPGVFYLATLYLPQLTHNKERLNPCLEQLIKAALVASKPEFFLK